MEKCAQSTLQLPSELVVARGNWTLRSRAPCICQFLSAVWVYSSWRNAWFISGYMLCVSSWCFWMVFFAKVNSFPEVDSRPALLGPRSLEKCAPVSASGCLGCYTLKSGPYFHEPRVFGSHCSLFQFCVRRVFPVSVTGGWRGRRESRLPGDPPPISFRDCCNGITAVDKHTVEHASETTTHNTQHNNTTTRRSRAPRGRNWVPSRAHGRRELSRGLFGGTTWGAASSPCC